MADLATMIKEVGDKFNATASELNSRMREIEMQWNRFESSPAGRGMAANDNYYGGTSLDDEIAASREIQDLTSTFRGKAVVKLAGERAAITSATSTVGSNTSAGTSLVPSHRVAGIIEPYQRQLTVRDVIGSARTTSNNVEYTRETGFTNNAAPVAETMLKPQSDLTFELYGAPVRTIAHTFKISRQMLDDVPALAAYVGRRGTYGLRSVEEQQLLFGNGTGQNLSGIIPQATAFAPTFSDAADTAFDRVNQAISQAEDAEVPVNAIILNKRDWRRMLAIKDGEDRYISGQSPFGLQDQRLWNLPVVATNVMPAGDFLVGAFGEAATIFDRLDVEVLISTENEDDFVKNLATVRIESRLALAVFRPEAFVVGDLYTAASS